MMTALHGIHVIIGVGLMIWLIVKARKGAYNAAYYTPVEITGLYWHLVDIIWIFLFPLLYLID
jgi:cytochrome c oxidase subunit III